MRNFQNIKYTFWDYKLNYICVYFLNDEKLTFKNILIMVKLYLEGNVYLKMHILEKKKYLKISELRIVCKI